MKAPTSKSLLKMSGKLISPKPEAVEEGVDKSLSVLKMSFVIEFLMLHNFEETTLSAIDA